ncbi:MAG: aminoacyl-tRNA deacylase [Candidatus Hodarchaeales archaeon]|jgi:prolyl-tRNA editing enzyme YbaK/EbsC (Cys-tRNA(Pro) deacylase)
MNLQNYIEDNGLLATIITVDVPTRTVEETCKALKCKSEEIVKSIVVVDSLGTYYLIILQGNRKIKTSKLKKLLLVKDITLASPKNVRKHTGYYVGDVPPISLKLPTILDELVLNQQKVYGGGGDDGKNLLLSVEELIESTHPLIADISQPL